MSSAMIDLILQATLDTLYMVAVSGVISALLGVPLGVLLYVTRPRQILARPVLNQVLGMVTNIGRSIPFIILMVAIIPFTRMIVGTSIGTNAAIVPLTIAAIPFVARLVEGALNEIPLAWSKPPSRWAPPPTRSSARCCCRKRGAASSPG